MICYGKNQLCNIHDSKTAMANKARPEDAD